MVLPAAGVAAALSSRSASAFVCADACAITTRAAMSFAAGEASSGVVLTLAIALAKEVMGSMLIRNLKVVALNLLLLGAVATGAGLLNQSLAMKGEPTGLPVGQPPLAAKSDGQIQRPAPGRMFVTGRVLDLQGKPVPDAVTMVYARFKEPGRGISQQHMNAAPFGEGHGDGSGRFRIDAPCTSCVSIRRSLDTFVQSTLSFGQSPGGDGPA